VIVDVIRCDFNQFHLNAQQVQGLCLIFGENIIIHAIPGVAIIKYELFQSAARYKITNNLIQNISFNCLTFIFAVLC